MKQNFSRYFPWFLAGVLAVFSLGANSSAFGEREVIATITKLNGDVIVLQRQLRDLQESVDKSQAQSTLMLQKLSENSDNSSRILLALDDQVKTSNTAQINNLSGTTTRLNQIVERLGNSDQKFNQITNQINALRETIESNQRRSDEERARERQERESREKQSSEAVPTINSPDQLYGFAFQQFSAAKYEQAITNFRRYLDAYGQTEAADNAQYMVAESLFALNRQQEALTEYDKLITYYPRGDKVAGALLKKGLLLLQLERREEGVNTLRNLISTLPNTPESVQATQELNRLGESIQAPPTNRPATGRQRTGRP